LYSSDDGSTIDGRTDIALAWCGAQCVAMPRMAAPTGWEEGWQRGLDAHLDSLKAALEALIVAILWVQRSRSCSGRMLKFLHEREFSLC
jgi:hypothetical protein